MGTKCGRPALMSADDVESIIEPYINEIFIDGRIASKHASVWKKLSAESNGAKGAKGFYSHVIDNRNNIQRKFSNPESNNISIFNETTEISDITVASKVIDSSINPNIETVSINFTYREFNDLVQEKDYKLSDRNRPDKHTRQYSCFVPGEWQRVVSEKLWAKKVQHGFNFKTHKIYFTLEARVTAARKLKAPSKISHAII